jgi:demethylmenaquinone methyltransferase / 2-methoxy-6-polyprenyl-1,4-benzoquinol methylase
MTSSSESVRKLFDEMAETYGLVHLFSSLGFAYSWRRACSSAIPSSSRRALDVMAGCGEMAPHLEKRLGAELDLTLLDFSEGMCRRATQNAKHWPRSRVKVVQDDALRMPFADGAFDAVTCSFGLKTLTADEVTLFAAELFRVVRPGGTVSLLEFSGLLIRY